METGGKSIPATSKKAAEQIPRQLELPDPRQVAIWRAMTPAQRLELAFQVYQFVLEIVRCTERHAHPDLAPEELNWRITRRMQGDPTLGR